ncbi:MAG: Ig-like domain-containing protein, partial [Planctomycetes bacterium]|nr:Ig-like domain-containing protein [Planctomycetota bacterium]
MGNSTRLAAIALLGLAACGSGGGSGSNSGSGGNVGSAFGVVNLISHSPADGEVQVALDAVLTLEFDADMALETFGYEDTWLRETETGAAVEVQFAPGTNGRVSVQPTAPLKAETDYTFQLSALTTDLSGRILDVRTSFSSRTFDETPPTLTGFDVANNATGVTRTGQFTLSFDEAIAQDSITDQTLYLRDIFGGRYACESTVVGQTVVMDPHADLPGNRQFFVVATTA